MVVVDAVVGSSGLWVGSFSVDVAFGRACLEDLSGRRKFWGL